MDFYKIKTRIVKRNGEPVVEVYPDFIVGKSKDLMIRAKDFAAVWDEDLGLWSTDEYDVQRLVDADLYQYSVDHADLEKQGRVDVKYLSDFSSGSWKIFQNYLNTLSDSYHTLDSNITFANTEVRKEDYVSHRLPYPIENVPCDSYNEIMDILYSPAERMKLEWAVGAVIAGDARYIQKFLVLYGAPGTGKGTFIHILTKLFPGYYTAFEAKELGASNNSFAAEVFKTNPLIAIQHDGDLSKIEDNTRLNSIISHEDMVINEKNKPLYTTRLNAFLFMGTNKPVKITDAKSGIIRRLIDVSPTGNLIPENRYMFLLSKIDFELGGIANRCYNVYRKLGKSYYSNYRAIEMMLQTDVFFNYIDAYYDVFESQEGISLAQAYQMYTQFCDESNIQYKMPQYRFREELKNYFDTFSSRATVNDERVRSYYSGFKKEKFSTGKLLKQEEAYSLVLDSTESLLDRILADSKAPYANQFEVPKKRWSSVDTVLKDLDTNKLHYVQPPQNHIVIDFDLKNELGEKDAERNLEEASKWPSTYAEWSKGGNGIHLHYIWTGGDPSELAPVYSDGIEVKVFNGDASLRRKLSMCNDVPIAELSSGLPVKEKKMYDAKKMMSERGMRRLIEQNLRKEHMPSTKSSMDFINKILQDAERDGLTYDIRDMRPKIMSFAMQSTNQSDYCLKLLNQMKFVSDDILNNDGRDRDVDSDAGFETGKPEVIFDLEVYPNLFYISWKRRGADETMVHMFNPSPQEVEQLLQFKLIGFNNRHYDNHILYARYMGYDNKQLFDLSQRIIGNESKNSTFAEAYRLSYADVYDIVTKKQSLKKYEIELGLPHKEWELDWDQPVPEELWPKVAEYCDNDVLATEAVLDNRKADETARKILAELSGLTMNDTTRAHTARIIFGKDRTPQKKFIYTDLSEMFPGYEFSFGKSTYRDEIVGEGGYVYSEPGMYENVAVLDVASMHPTSIKELELFGPYTDNFFDLLRTRLFIKHKNYDKARKMFDGKLEPYLKNEDDAEALAYALKIVINSVYGLTAARFPNPFKDERNVDNIVAKRGALFMIDLKHAVQEQGYSPIHIKTDSIKIPNATPEIIDFVIDYGKKYGYDFELENIYRKMCLVNDAVYIAQKSDGVWEATGAQFKHPYVFKFLFSQEPIVFDDLCETKAVTTSLYLDMNESLPDGEHDYKFVGRVGRFCPVFPGAGGGLLVRKDKNDPNKFGSATGAKDHRWLEASVVKELHKEDSIDMTYFEKLTQEAIENISKYGSFESFVGDQPIIEKDIS